jgi:cell division protease FtsH
MSESEAAKDKILMGSERKTMIIGPEEKKAIAYHEAGHTIVGKSLPGLDPVHKVTIIPRGMALGLTQTLPDEDQLTLSADKAERMISFLMGGAIAEYLIFGQKTTGAGNDIERATDLARRMVCEWGMSEKIGPVAVGKKEGDVFLGREISQTRNISERLAEQIDAEVRDIIVRNYNRGVEILQSKMSILHAMAAALLERESLDRSEIESLMDGRVLPAFVPPASQQAPKAKEADDSRLPLGLPNRKSEVA